MDLLNQVSDMSFSLFSFILMIVIVVGFHEFGHFITARICNIKVLTFSIGMGKKIFTWRSKRSGIEYALSALPFGGYVKMLDESDVSEITTGNYSQEDLERSFNRAPLWKRFLVVFNGPLFNLILALIIFFGINLNGVTYPKPIVGSVSVPSWASHSGFEPNDLIIKVGDKEVYQWKEVIFGVIDSIGRDNVHITVVRDNNEVSIYGDMNNWELERKDRDLLGKLGLIPIHANLPNIISKIVEDSPAEKHGLQKGDKIIQIGNQKINSFADISKTVQLIPDETVSIVIERNNIERNITVNVGSTDARDGQKIGVLGVYPQVPKYNPEWFETRNMSIVEALNEAAKQSIYMLDLTAGFVKKLVTGDLSLTLISGPVTMADSAGQSASHGVIAFLSFCALISINLMIMNLLPIPGLDGGHLATYAIEAVKGDSLSEYSQKIALRIGIFCIASLMAFAILMDILDLFS